MGDSPPSVHRARLLFRLVVVTLLLAGAVAASVQGAASRSRPAEITEHAREILADPRYQQELPLGGDVELPKQLDLRRVEAPLGDLPVPSGPGPGGGMARLLMLGMLALVVVYLAVWAFFESRSLRQARLVVVGEEGIAAAESPDRDPALADELAADGRFADAVHALLVDALHCLQRAQRVTIRSSTTSREVIHQMTREDDARSLVMTLVVAVEQSLFGGMMVSRDDYLRCRAAWLQITQAAT